MSQKVLWSTPVTATPADPGQDTVLTWEAPATAPLDLITVRFNVNTSSTTGGRRVVITGTDATDQVLFRLPFTVTVGASSHTVTLCASKEIPVQTGGDSGYDFIPLPEGPWPPGMKINLNVPAGPTNWSFTHIRITYRLALN